MSDLTPTVLTVDGTVKQSGGDFSSADFSPTDFDTGTVDPAARRAALRLVGSEQDRRQELFELLVDYAKATPEWSRTLTDPETDRWEGQIKGYGDRVNELTACPFTDATTTELAAAIARGCGKFSHLPSQQRMRAYKAAAKKRKKHAKRNEAIRREHAAGTSQRKLADRYGLSRGGVAHILQGAVSTANRPLVDNSLFTANRPPRADQKPTANRPIGRPVSRPMDHSAMPPGEVASRPPLEGATGHVPAVSQRKNEGSAPTDKRGWVGEGDNPSLNGPAPASAASHPGNKRPPETEPASGGATRGVPEVGQRLDEVLRSLVESKRSVHEVPPNSPTITDPEQIAKREARKREYERVAAARLGKEAAE